MTQRDETLKILLCKVFKAPKGSAARAKVMHLLILEIQSLHGILRASHPDYPAALNQTWIWVCKNIENFDIEKSSLQNVTIEVAFVNWINGYLRYRIRDLEIAQQPNHTSIEQIQESPIGTLVKRNLEDKLTSPTLEGLEAVIEQEQRQQQSELYKKIIAIIQQDPDNILKDCHSRINPSCTCHLLCQRYLLKEPPDAFTQIAQDLDMNYQTLVGFWKRTCLKKLQKMVIQIRCELDQS